MCANVDEFVLVDSELRLSPLVFAYRVAKLMRSRLDKSIVHHIPTSRSIDRYFPHRIIQPPMQPFTATVICRSHLRSAAGPLVTIQEAIGDQHIVRSLRIGSLHYGQHPFATLSPRAFSPSPTLSHVKSLMPSLSMLLLLYCCVVCCTRSPLRFRSRRQPSCWPPSRPARAKERRRSDQTHTALPLPLPLPHTSILPSRTAALVDARVASVGCSVLRYLARCAGQHLLAADSLAALPSCVPRTFFAVLSWTAFHPRELSAQFLVFRVLLSRVALITSVSSCLVTASAVPSPRVGSAFARALPLTTARPARQRVPLQFSSVPMAYRAHHRVLCLCSGVCASRSGARASCARRRLTAWCSRRRCWTSS